MSNPGVSFKKSKSEDAVPVPAAFLAVIASAAHRGPLPACPCPAPGQPGCPPPGALAAALVVASAVLHGASSVSTAPSDFKCDKVLGASPSLALLGSPCRGPSPALFGIRCQQVTEVTQVTVVRQVIEVS
ncbi:hypothetical protein HJG60_011140 [Phyllostomus discolor]|uniref:Uncharacterized protein n=1 Tax=Phyllostomus discolor TaxID=89673 RepID=A0A834E552_9CHIR|nr:hypothetical protein HJG60_011140 [Phyllostomus discolor]